MSRALTEEPKRVLLTHPAPTPFCPLPRTLLWLLWDYYHMMKICFDDVKGCIAVSKAWL